MSVDYRAVMASLRETARELKKSPQTEKIYLFGSFARGSHTPFSDVDILVVVKNTDRPFLERKEQYAGSFAVPFDVNILVYTRREMDRLQKENSKFLENVLKEAIEL